MEKRSLEAVIVFGKNSCSTELYYFIRTRIPRGGIYLKKLGEKPILILGNIDVKSGEKGLVKKIKTYTEYDYEKLNKRYGSSKVKVYFYDHLIKKHGIEEKIGIYGSTDCGEAYYLINKLKNMGHKVVSEKRPNLIDRLMETKDKSEISEITNVGSSVEVIVSKTIDMITNTLSNGKEITVGDSKEYAQILMAEMNLFPIEDFILSSGENTMDPHSIGEEHQKIQLNTPIIMDFFPRNNNLFYFDFTRTYVIGRASKKIKQMYNDVIEAQGIAFDKLNENVTGCELMEIVCDFFENKGYPTVRRLLHKTSRLERGFIHSLGHGVGWSLSDLPILSLLSEDKLKRGQVFTLEPGIYMPRVGGVRVEDVYSLVGGEVKKISHLDTILER
jgi:Xaa-Pro aminopeptidase